MNANPYQSPEPGSPDTGHRSRQRNRWIIQFVFLVVVPPLVVIGFYIPFGFLSSKVNNYFDGDDFFYRTAVATWPGYSASVAITLTLLGRRVRLGWFHWLLVAVHGFVAIYCYMGYFQYGVYLDRMGFPADDTGLGSWPVNEESSRITTPLISVIAVPIVYCLTAICTRVVTSLRTRAERPPGWLDP